MPSLFHLFAPHSSAANSQHHDHETPPPVIAELSLQVEENDHCSNKRKHNRKVSFCPSVMVFEYIRWRDMSEDEIGQTWYNRQELHEIHLENVHTVCRMTNGSWPSDAVFCARGLESRTTAGARRRLKNRMDVLQAVREYQALEAKEGTVHDPVRLAQVYANLTAESSRIARLMANIDAQATAEAKSVPPTKTPTLINVTRATPDRCFPRLSSSECISPSIVRVL